jgi:hypothetical protein
MKPRSLQRRAITKSHHKIVKKSHVTRGSLHPVNQARSRHVR